VVRVLALTIMCSEHHWTPYTVTGPLNENSKYFVYGVGIALGYGLDDPGFDSRQRLGIFLFTTASRMALGPTQPPIQ